MDESRTVSERQDILCAGRSPTVEEPRTIEFKATEGRTAILPCRVRDLGQHKVVWADTFTTTLTFKDRRVIDDDRFSVDTNFKNKWDLRIEKVKLSDSGGYICSVNTEPPIKHTVQLTVVVPPRITRPSHDKEINVPEFDKAELTCEAEGKPKPNISWTRQSHVETQAGSQNIVIGTGETLIIHNASRECAGVYYCEADNGVLPSARRTFDVKVQFPPQIHLANKRLGQVLGKDTVLECIISGQPTSQVYWVFEGRQLDKATYERKKYQLCLSVSPMTLCYGVDLSSFSLGGSISTKIDDVSEKGR
ncbi:opioid-binding protein/cell adhesion molecule [Elysia marginata]|uniref:Opioid-binding protein/cell adhesion molecule n=1 Tax=Elysia marginata TaxID=1093978 RepID=A0AAV4F7R7_9GAST|nr:opioid-binding protein/cell adhesion molecule [Elysia marginata]